MHWKHADIVKKLDNKVLNNFILSLKLRDWEPNKINFLVELFYKKNLLYKKANILFFKSKNFFDITF